MPLDKKQREFETGSVRDTREGKGRFDLLPPYAMEELAKVFERGVYYGERNWELGQPLSAFTDSAVRHIFKWMRGEEDEDHLAAAAWNVMCALDTRCRIRTGRLPSSLEDLPVQNVENMNDSTTDVSAFNAEGSRCENTLRGEGNHQSIVFESVSSDTG